MGSIFMRIARTVGSIVRGIGRVLASVGRGIAAAFRWAWRVSATIVGAVRVAAVSVYNVGSVIVSVGKSVYGVWAWIARAVAEALGWVAGMILGPVAQQWFQRVTYVAVMIFPLWWMYTRLFPPKFVFKGGSFGGGFSGGGGATGVIPHMPRGVTGAW